MRQYDTASGILIILSITGFALAAPVSVQEKRQESLKDVITVLGKRGDEGLLELGEEYFKTLEKPVASSSTHSSSSSAPSGPDPGSTNAVQPPAPNVATSTANPDPLTDPSSCSTSSDHGLQARGNCIMSLAKSLDEGYKVEASNDFSLGLQALHAPVPPAHTQASRIELPVFTGPRVPQADPYWEPAPLTPTDTDFDWNYWPKSPQREIGETSSHALPPPESQPSPESTDPESQSLSTDYQTEDPQTAAIYAAKGKAKVSGTVRDVGNLA